MERAFFSKSGKSWNSDLTKSIFHLCWCGGEKHYLIKAPSAADLRSFPVGTAPRQEARDSKTMLAKLLLALSALAAFAQGMSSSNTLSPIFLYSYFQLFLADTCDRSPSTYIGCYEVTMLKNALYCTFFLNFPPFFVPTPRRTPPRPPSRGSPPRTSTTPS